MKIKQHIQALALTLAGASVIYSGQALSDQVIADDLILSPGAGDASLCIGIDCIDGEIFGFDGIKLKADDPLIMFNDTSSTGSFPSNDWSVGISDYGLAGSADFIVKDVSGGSNVMVLEAGAFGGIALGAGSTVVENAISVGATAAERRITHVAPGVADTDAINLSQVPALLVPVNARIDALNVRINDLLTRINNL
ncbi:MAG: hypothetical protein OEY29_14830 [Gammaproteobacteria bacterium]|nr:hypothetical protein [Gammaproteobacteria bacterium]